MPRRSNLPTRTLRTLVERRTVARDGRLRGIGRSIDRVTRRLEERTLGIVAANRGGREGVIGSVDAVMIGAIFELSELVGSELRKLVSWSFESASTATIRSLPLVYWVRRLRPVVPVLAIEGVPYRMRDHLASLGFSRNEAISLADRAAKTSQDLSTLQSSILLERDSPLEAEIEIQRILDGEATAAEAVEIVRAIEFPPPTPEQIDAILNATSANDGLSAMSRIKTVESARMGEVRDLIKGAFSGGFEGASAVEAIAPRLRHLVGNDPGQSTGMNYRAKRIARTEGVRIAETGLRETWEEVGDVIEAIVWYSARVPRTRPDHAARHEKRYLRTSSREFIARDGERLPEIPLGPNCLCWTSAELRADLTDGLPQENLGAWYDPAALRAEKATQQHTVPT